MIKSNIDVRKRSRFDLQAALDGVGKMIFDQFKFLFGMRKYFSKASEVSEARQYSSDPDPDCPLVCVVTGMEHSGTTLLSQLLNGHPRVAAGVECGLLLSDLKNYDKFQPFWDWLLNENWGWAIKERDREKLLRARSFDEAYHLLAHYKGRNHSNSELRDIFVNSDLIYDKTPAYVYQLQQVLRKTNAPFVITFKTPREAMDSAKKRNVDLKEYFRSYKIALQEISKCVAENPNQVLVVSYKTLSSRPLYAMQMVQNFINLNGVTLTIERYNSRFGRLVESRNSFSSSSIQYHEPLRLTCSKERRILKIFEMRNAKNIALVRDAMI